MSKETGGPAFPALPISRNLDNELVYQSEGLTMRDYFAAKAMQGFLVEAGCGPSDVKDFAESAYIMADAMLRAREAT